AGSGKTQSLVERIVSLVRQGTPVADVAAITFTEAAAAELRDRVTERIEKLALTAEDEVMEKAAASLEQCTITTLHSFARKMLAEHPFSVGLPPRFDVFDESSALVSFDERWGSFVGHLLEAEEHQDLMARAISCGLHMPTFKDVGRACDQNWDRLEGLHVTVPPRPPVDQRGMVELLHAAVALGTRCDDPEDKLALHLGGTVRTTVHALEEAADELDVLQLLVATKVSARVGQARHWTDSSGHCHKDEVTALLTAAGAEGDRILGETKDWILRSLLHEVAEATLAAATERRDAGRLLFHDLLVLARNLVRDDSEARRLLHDRYRMVLIDEFQDTDPLQAELAFYLAAGPGADGVTDWKQLAVPPGRLFFVGDPKQSIYRFRRADIEVYRQTKTVLNAQERLLQANFRSRPEIVEWCNALFGAMFGDTGTDGQPGYAPLAAHVESWTEFGGPGRVLFLGADAETDKTSIKEIRGREARDAVAAIGTLCAHGWKVGPADQPARYSDVAVLMPARTGLPILEDAFNAAGIPYRLESSSLVYETREVHNLLAVLRAADDPLDEVAVLGALRSAGFGCADDELVRHREGGGSWVATPTAASSVPPVEHALHRLAELAEVRWQVPVSELVARIVQDRRLMAIALAGRRPREAWRRLRFVMDQARVFTETTGGDLRQFLRWVEFQRDERIRVKESVLPETDDDAVRILTVHAAKGLEYPVVVLVGLQKSPDTNTTPILFTETGIEFRVRSGFETAGFKSAAEHERDMEAYEQQRLLYVAATRARDVLVVCLHRDGEDRKRLADQVHAHCSGTPDLWSDGAVLLAPHRDGAAAPAGAAAPTESRPVQLALLDDDLEDRMAFIARRAALMEAASVPRTLAATAVARLAHSDAVALEEVTAEDAAVPDEPGMVHHRGRGGTAVGRAVHGVLQLVDLRTGEDLEALVRAQATAEGVVHRMAEVHRLARAALDSDLVRRAVAGGRYWREVYVGAPVGGRVLEGFVDLLFESSEGYYIVDYKTDRLAGDDAADAVHARYREQGASYGLAVRASLGVEVAGCSFLVLRPDGALEVPLDDLAGAMADVEALVGACPSVRPDSADPGAVP
ncbi:MAG TPA: UvrD-helicase domain-containing protein, partial [Acidimicrobiales bacterium]|nr:UvrD-helicase domain-containing protein [Acidimicrobiales bacterium]